MCFTYRHLTLFSNPNILNPNSLFSSKGEVLFSTSFVILHNMLILYTQWVFKNPFNTELLSVHLGPVKYALVWPYAWNFPGSPSPFLGPVICTIFPQFCSSLQKLSSHGTPLQSSRGSSNKQKTSSSKTRKLASDATCTFTLGSTKLLLP